MQDKRFELAETAENQTWGFIFRLNAHADPIIDRLKRSREEPEVSLHRCLRNRLNAPIQAGTAEGNPSVFEKSSESFDLNCWFAGLVGGSRENGLELGG